MSLVANAIAAATAGVAAVFVWRLSTAPSSTFSVEILSDKASLGEAAAEHVAAHVTKTVAEKGHARVIVATGASQFEFLAALLRQSAPWHAVTFFHLDEYCGLPADHPAAFRRYLRERFFSKLQPKAAAVHYVDPDKAADYASRLAEADIDIACIGIGENGHIAFNDPPVADFNDPLLVKKARLRPRPRPRRAHDHARADHRRSALPRRCRSTSHAAGSSWARAGLRRSTMCPRTRSR